MVVVKIHKKIMLNTANNCLGFLHGIVTRPGAIDPTSYIRGPTGRGRAMNPMALEDEVVVATQKASVICVPWSYTPHPWGLL